MAGEARQAIAVYRSSEYALKPSDFIGIFPKLLVKEGDRVKAGTPVFHDKFREDLNFTSPVSGTIKEIRRGDKRVLQEIVISADDTIEYEPFEQPDIKALTREIITTFMLKSGVWPVLRQRPFSTIANPNDNPKAIFISGFDTAPLAPDIIMMVTEQLMAFKNGLAVLGKLTTGKVHIGLPEGRTELAGIKGVETTFYTGPHPAGNVGVHIYHTDPINKGDIVWIINAQDVSTIGKLFVDGKYDPTMSFALTGSEVKNPQYYRVRKGVSVKELLKDNLKSANVRCISGNVLTGTRIRTDGYLGFYHHQVTVIPEGDQHEFMGWAAPGFNKFSFSRSYFSWLTPKRKFKLDTNLHGGERALVMTGQYEQVLPMDILPMQLIKACMIEDIELMEKLGIYEVDEEDFALIEYIDTSKTDIQKIIRKGLDLIRKEMS